MIQPEIEQAGLRTIWTVRAGWTCCLNWFSNNVFVLLEHKSHHIVLGNELSLGQDIVMILFSQGMKYCGIIIYVIFINNRQS